MIRALIITAVAGLVLAIACFAGAAALGGRELFENGWTVLPAELRADDENVHISIGEALDPDESPDLPAPATNQPAQSPPSET